MEPAVAEAAMRLRAALVRDAMEPAAFRSALQAVPEDERDGWLDLVCDCVELPEDGPLPRGCVPYLPSAVATVLEAIERTSITPEDVFVDVGAGVGRAAMMVHLLTGARCVGLEIQGPLVEAARASVDALGLSGVRFVEGDALEHVRQVGEGTVFFLYCPFGGDRLDRVLDDLATLARLRPIRLCTVGMPPLERPWLEARPSTSVDLAVYRSV